MNVASYLAKRYDNPPCWHLAVDVLATELGLQLADYTPDGKGSLAVAHAFRLALHNGEHGCAKVECPQNLDIVLLSRKSGSDPQHCGVWVDGRVLHAMPGLVVWEPLVGLQDRFRHIEYWRHNGHH